MLALLLAAQLAAARPAGVGAPPAATPPDSALRARADSAIRELLLAWRAAWMDTQDGRSRAPDGFGPGDLDQRAFSVHCHAIAAPRHIRASLITGATPSHATCPWWYPAGGARLDDERRSLDGGLQPGARLRLRMLRQQVRALVDSAAARDPADAALAAQRVRLALDGDDLRGAVVAAAGCAAGPVPCGLLQGLVLHRLGLDAAADSTFLAAGRLMPDDERCRWNDVAVLLEPEQRAGYERLPCAGRAELEARLWWLADPLWSEPGNERRAEHFARKVLVTLHATGLGDARQRWEPRKGGESVAESLVRYGWPTQLYWGGIGVDTSHDSWLLRFALDTAPPYVVREYSRGRLHVVPSAAALRAPFVAAPDAWELNAPPDDWRWWPREHFARDRGPIVQLPLGQWVMLRRRDATRFVWAADLDGDALARPDGDAVPARLFASHAVGDVARAGEFVGRVGRPLVVEAPLARGPVLLGVELAGDTARPAARTRFGVEVAPPLSALAGGRALSAPLLFDPPADASRALDADAAIARMFGTTVFAGVRRLGVYWEAYGFAARDSVEIEVRVARVDRPGMLARLGGALGLGTAVRDSVGIRWREAPGSGRAIQRREGGVPVQMRSIVLELSRLERGQYRVTLRMRRVPGAVDAESDRLIVLR